LRRLKKTVAWCYCQLSVSRHLRTPSTDPKPRSYLSPRVAGRSAARKITEL
jgi:hypothetical protein